MIKETLIVLQFAEQCSQFIADPKQYRKVQAALDSVFQHLQETYSDDVLLDAIEEIYTEHESGDEDPEPGKAPSNLCDE